MADLANNDNTISVIRGTQPVRNALQRKLMRSWRMIKLDYLHQLIRFDKTRKVTPQLEVSNHQRQSNPCKQPHIQMRVCWAEVDMFKRPPPVIHPRLWVEDKQAVYTQINLELESKGSRLSITQLILQTCKVDFYFVIPLAEFFVLLLQGFIFFHQPGHQIVDKSNLSKFLLRCFTIRETGLGWLNWVYH